MVNQRADEVLSLFHRVVLCGLRLFAVFWYLHMPRIHPIKHVTFDGFTKHRRGKGTDVLECVLALLRFEARQERACLLRGGFLQRCGAEVILQMLVPNMLDAAHYLTTHPSPLPFFHPTT